MKKLVLTLLICLLPCYGWGGVDFNGDADKIVISNSTDFDGDGSVSFWFKTDGVWETDGAVILDVACMISRHDNSPITSGQGIFIGPRDAANGGAMTFLIKNASGIVFNKAGSIDITDNAWHHVVAVFDNTNGSTQTLYLDGSSEISSTVSAAWSFDSQDIQIAESVDSFWEQFGGIITEFTWWNTKLTQTQAQQLYNAGLKRMALQIAPSNNKVTLSMNDGSDGSTMSTASNFYKDSSGNGNHGTGTDVDGDSTNIAEEALTYP